MLSSVLHSRSQSADSLVSTVQPLQNSRVENKLAYKQNTRLTEKTQSSSRGLYDNLNLVTFSASDQNNSRNPAGHNNHSEYLREKATSQRNTSYNNDTRTKDIADFLKNRSQSGFVRDVGGEVIRGSTRVRPSMGVSGSLYSKKYHSTESMVEGESRACPVNQLLNPTVGGSVGYNAGYNNNKEAMEADGILVKSAVEFTSPRLLEHSAPRSVPTTSILSPAQQNTPASNFNHTAGYSVYSPIITSPTAENPIKSPLSPPVMGNSSKFVFNPSTGNSRIPPTSPPAENPVWSPTVSYPSTHFAQIPASGQFREPGIMTHVTSNITNSFVSPAPTQTVPTISPRYVNQDSRRRNPTQNKSTAQTRPTLQGRSVNQKQQTVQDHHITKHLVPTHDNPVREQSRINKSNQQSNQNANQQSNQIDEIDTNRAVRSRVSRSSSALVDSGGRPGPRVRLDGSGGRITQQPPTGRPVNQIGATAGNGPRQATKSEDKTDDNKKYQFKASIRATSNNRTNATSNQTTTNTINTNLSPQKNTDRYFVTNGNNNSNNNNMQLPHKSSVNMQLQSQGKKAISTMELNRNYITFQHSGPGYHKRDKSLPARETDPRKLSHPATNGLTENRGYSARYPNQESTAPLSGGLEKNSAIDRRFRATSISPNRRRVTDETDGGATRNGKDISIHPSTLCKTSHYFSNPELNLSTVAPDDNVEIRRLRRMLADKDYELASVRETFSENEKSILRVLEERSRTWRQESSARQMEWERSLAGHIERSLQHDASMRRQLADSQQDAQKALSELQSVKSQLSELQEKYDKLKINYDSVVAENERLNQMGISGLINSNNAEKLHENGKLGVWSVVGKTAAVEMMIEGNVQRKQVMFKPINDYINEESSQFDTSSESDMGSLSREVKFSNESNRTKNELIFPKREADHAQIPAAAQLIHPGYRGTPRRPIDYSTPSNSSLSSSSNSQHSRDDATSSISQNSRDGGTGLISQHSRDDVTGLMSQHSRDVSSGSKFSNFTRQASSSSSSTSRHSKDGANGCEYFNSSRDAVQDDTHTTGSASNRRSRRVTFGGGDDNQNSYIQTPVSNSSVQKERWNGSISTRNSSINASTNSPQNSASEQKIKSLNAEVENVKKNLEECKRSFDSERERWLREKDQVINYQSTLQQNYMQLLSRNRALEQELTGIRSQTENL